jgi:RNA polymerase sigma factor (TIGR02999 family)
MSQSTEETGEITEILSRWNQAKDESLDEVFPQVYETLKRLARKARRLMGRTDPEETLCTGSLVNEMYLKLRQSGPLEFKSRGHFYAFCRLAMQRTLRDYYVRKSAKRNEVRLGGEAAAAVFEVVGDFAPTRISGAAFYTPLEVQLLCHEVLIRLAEKHPRKAEVMWSKYVLGETEQEVARQLGISEATVRRDCSLGEVLIKAELDNKVKLILKEASEIPDAEARGEYLRAACGENRGLLRHLQAELDGRAGEE